MNKRYIVQLIFNVFSSKRYFFKYLYFFVLVLLMSVTQTLAQVNLRGFEIATTPSWVKKYPKPKLEDNYKLDLVLIQSDEQYNHITKESFSHYYYYLNNIDGLNKIKSFFWKYEPSYQVCKVNVVNIHRGDRIIPMNTQLHTEFELYGKQIGGNRYDEDAKIKVFFEGVSVGDIIEIAYTIEGIQPDIYGKLERIHYSYQQKFRGKDIVRIVYSNDQPLFYRTLNYDVESKISIGSTYSSIEFESSNNKELNFPEVPQWYSTNRKIYFFESDSWEDYIKLNLKNFKLEEVPSKKVKDKVQELTKSITTKPDKINAILNYSQKDIHYLDYGLINPKRPETVLTQGFGDCKSKSLLTIKMLECLGIESWPLIVKYNGFDKRLLDVYSGQTFDHCVLEFVFNGDTLIYDPTNVPQKGGLNDKFTKDFKYGLRIKKEEKEITKLKHHSDNSLNVFVSMDTKDDGWGKYYVNWKIDFGGQIANLKNDLYVEGGVNSVFESISKELLGYTYITSSDYNLSFSFEKERPNSILNIKSKENSYIFDDNSDGATVFLPRPLYSWFKIPKPEDLGEYFTLPKVIKTNQTFKIPLTEWIDFTSDSSNFENDWIKYKKKTWIEDDTIYASYSAETYKTFLDSSSYQDVVETIDHLKKDMTILLEKNIHSETATNRRYMFYILRASLLVLVIFTVWLIIRFRKKRRALIHKLRSDITRLEKEIEDLSI
ncbi:DUF3857 domain-containing protein [Sediminitomix flava]|uniref:Uncharacterized protein DUF3857 n=1 Tax=Sediminitomix flava TaxID=379075 RepID=A0A315YY74_SEDFL|nr:DUF3857 domain-containing protein [Sediminitomix flava]PWJ35007.1 uncharacterized protein DUF3857 [Sediminitomix flava]